MDDSEIRDNIRRLSSAREEALEDTRFSDDGSERSRPAEPPPSAAIRPPSKHAHPFSYHVLTLMAPFAMFGLLARLGLQALTNFDGEAVFPLAWVQGAGCFLWGSQQAFANQYHNCAWRNFWRVAVIIFTHRDTLSSYAPLYFAIATGALFSR